MVKAASIIFILSFSLFGCANDPKVEIQYIEKPIYVEVPVLQEIHLEKPSKPKNYLKKISATSTPAEVAEAYVNTIKEQQFYIKKLEKLIEPFVDK